MMHPPQFIPAPDSSPALSLSLLRWQKYYFDPGDDSRRDGREAGGGWGTHHELLPPTMEGRSAFILEGVPSTPFSAMEALGALIWGKVAIDPVVAYGAMAFFGEVPILQKNPEFLYAILKKHEEDRRGSVRVLDTLMAPVVLNMEGERFGVCISTEMQTAARVAYVKWMVRNWYALPSPLPQNLPVCVLPQPTGSGVHKHKLALHEHWDRGAMRTHYAVFAGGKAVKIHSGMFVPRVSATRINFVKNGVWSYETVELTAEPEVSVWTFTYETRNGQDRTLSSSDGVKFSWIGKAIASWAEIPADVPKGIVRHFCPNLSEHLDLMEEMRKA